ncbi:MAG: RNA polymerase sigma factor [Bryobacteraceae bacterium]
MRCGGRGARNLLRAYRQLNRYESRSSFSTWVYKIASNYALDLMRSRKRHEDRWVAQVDGEETSVLANLKGSEPAQDRIYYSKQLRRKLDGALAELSNQERTAFLLRHCEGQSIEEIGSVLSIGTSATKNSIFRAVRKLREALEPVVNTI